MKTSLSCRQPYNYLSPITMSFCSKGRKIAFSRFLGCSTPWRISENGYLFPLHSLDSILPTLLLFLPSSFTHSRSKTVTPALQTWNPRSSAWAGGALGELHSHFHLHTARLLCSLCGWMPGIQQLLQLPSWIGCLFSGPTIPSLHQPKMRFLEEFWVLAVLNQFVPG